MKTCSHCRSTIPRGKATSWTVALCANGGRRRRIFLCRPCDIAINRHMLIVMGDPDVNEKMERYAEASQ